MAESYAKLLSSILDSSIWAEPDDVLRVWVTLLAMADRDGYVAASVGGISRRTHTVSPERVAECLDMFQRPDPDSRSSDHDGARIAKVDRGWMLINYKKIRDMHGADEREAELERKRRWWNENRGKGAQLPPPEKQLDDTSASESSLDTSYGGGVASVLNPDRARAKVPCPADLRLTDDQRGALETSLIPGWAIDAITTSFVASAVADQDDLRQLTHWRKCLSKAIAGQWNDSKRRPKKPESDEPKNNPKLKPGQVMHRDGYAYYPPGAKVS